MRAPGWEDFDRDVVAGLHAGSADFLDKSPNGGMRCPLRGHEHRLGWSADDYRKGTEPHEGSGLRLRVSPTYILDDPLDNFIAGRELVAAALRREWKKAETHRLNYENSEDAVSWNVFRSLQEAAELPLAARALAGVDADAPVDLILWGSEIGTAEPRPVPAISRALERLEPTHPHQTEPDVVLHVPGWGWIFVEAKLSSPTTTYSRKPERLEAWIKRYSDPLSGVFNRGMLEKAKASAFPEQLLRNVAVAAATREPDEQAVVIALVREKYLRRVTSWGRDYLSSSSPVTAGAATWEQLYQALPPNCPELASLRDYMIQKSVRLRPAFLLGQTDDATTATPTRRR
jgi:restriction endonuclease-like protein